MKERRRRKKEEEKEKEKRKGTGKGLVEVIKVAGHREHGPGGQPQL